MRYAKQAMTLAQQIQTLQSRGLIIADTNKANKSAICFVFLSTFRNFAIKDGEFEMQSQR